MSPWKFRIGEPTPALQYTRNELERNGWDYDPDGKYLLLPVPTKKDYSHIITPNTVAIGGNISLPCRCINLLSDPFYLSENARITAYCALRYAEEKMSIVWYDCKVMIIGWGRIGKCLAQLLQCMGADVTVYARKEIDRAALTSLGYVSTDNLRNIKNYHVLFNTAPEPIISADMLSPQQIKIDLASIRGIGGEDVIWARGLPGKDAPESSGKLIAKTVERLRKEGIL